MIIRALYLHFYELCLCMLDRIVHYLLKHPEKKDFLLLVKMKMLFG